MRDDLVGEYIGQTAPKTQAVLSRAMGGVLFIDEAYTLYRTHDSKDYGPRSVRNALEGARFRHARRLVAEPERHWSRDDLMRLEPSDILPGRD
jgi:hypothetical protein